MKHPFDFLEFGESDAAWFDSNSVQLSVDLTSLANITAAGGALNGTGQTIDSSRGLIPNGAGGVAFANAAWMTAISTGHWHATLWVEDAALDVNTSYTGGIQYGLLIMGGANGPAVRAEQGANGNTLWTQTAGTQLNSYTASPYNTPNQLHRIDFSGTPGRTDTFIDKVLVSRVEGLSGSTYWGSSPAIYLGSLAGGTYGMPTAMGAIKYFQVSNRPIELPLCTPDVSVATFGDSITQQGGVPPNCPFEFDDSTGMPSIPSGIRGSAGYGMGIRRLFADYGLMPYVSNFGIAGQLSTLFVTEVGYCTTLGRIPTLATCMFGSDDVLAATITSQSQYEINIKAGIDALLAAGTQYIIVMSDPSVATDTGVTVTQAMLDAQTGYRAVLAALPATYPGQVYYLDAWSILGGDANPNPLFISTGVHPNENGHMTLSLQLNALIRSLLF